MRFTVTALIRMTGETVEVAVDAGDEEAAAQDVTGRGYDVLFVSPEVADDPTRPTATERLEAQLAPRRRDATIYMVLGILMVLVPLGVSSAIAAEAPRNGGQYPIFWGAMLLGFVFVVVGLARFPWGR